MKHTLLVFLALSFSGVINAQLEAKNFTVAFNKKLPVLETTTLNRELYGLEVEYLATDWLGLNYTVYANEEVFHMPGGIVAALGAFSLLSCSSGAAADIDSEILLYALAIPEGLSFNLQMVNNIYLTPYINPLGLEYAFGEDSEGMKFEDQVFMTGAGGVKLKGFMNIADKTSIVLSAFAESHTQYVANKQYGLRAGVGLGFVIY